MFPLVSIGLFITVIMTSRRKRKLPFCWHLKIETNKTTHTGNFRRNRHTNILASHI